MIEFALWAAVLIVSACFSVMLLERHERRQDGARRALAARASGAPFASEAAVPGSPAKGFVALFRPPPPRREPRPPSLQSPRPASSEDERRQAVPPRWVPSNETVRIAGRTVPGGLFYLGAAADRLVQGSVIDPDLPVAAASDGAEPLGYWPSYGAMTPSQRAAHLAWRAAGRAGPVDIGHVFVFFYGLERRLVVDKAASDAPAILAELQRLRRIYAEPSFERYARELAEVAAVMAAGGDLTRLRPNLDALNAGVQMSTRAALALLARDGSNVPFDWMFAWWLQSPNARLRTPAQRLPEEFRRLLHLRFKAEWPDGMPAPPAIGAENSYQGAARGLVTPLEGVTGSLYRADAVRRPVALFAKLADEAMEELAPLSRFAGRHSDWRERPEARAFVPAGLGGARVGGGKLGLWLEANVRGPTPLPASRLASDLSRPMRGRWIAQDLEAAAAALAPLGFGVEPDPRYGDASVGVGEQVVLFRALDREAVDGDAGIDGDAVVRFAPGEDYPPAAAASAFAAEILGRETFWASDAEAAASRLQFALRAAFSRLPDAAFRRLAALFLRLSLHPPKPASLKKRAGAVEESRRREAARAVLAACREPGASSPVRVAAFERVWDALGLDRKDLYADLHALASGALFPAAPSGDGAAALDPARVAAVRADTARASEILEEIFIDEDPFASPAPEPLMPLPLFTPPASASSVPEDLAHDAALERLIAVALGGAGARRFDGLEPAAAGLLGALSARDAWPRADYEDLARRRGLMPAGALETINEWSVDACGEAALEESGDAVAVRLDLLAKLGTAP